MTTICVKDGIIAADRLMTGAGGLRRTVSKIRDCGAYVFAGAGKICVVVPVEAWLAAGASPSDRPKLSDDGCHGFVVEKTTGHIYVVDGESPALYRIFDSQHAAGSGMDFALAGMALGLSAAEAVRFASKFDVFTGPEVDIVEIHPKESE